LGSGLGFAATVPTRIGPAPATAAGLRRRRGRVALRAADKVVDLQPFGAIGQPRDDITEFPVLRAILPARAPARLSARTTNGSDRLFLVLGAGLSPLPIARIAIPAVSRVIEVSVHWNLEGQARPESFLEASLAVPVVSRRVEVAV
jgi:hypothetical protein